MSSSTVNPNPLKRTNSHSSNGPDNTKKARVTSHTAPERSKSSDQGSATALTVSQEDFTNLNEYIDCIRELVIKAQFILKKYYPPQERKATKGKKPVKHPQHRKNPSMAKNLEQTSPTDDQSKFNNHSTTQTAPSSDDSRIERLLDEVVRMKPQKPTLGEERHCPSVHVSSRDTP